MPTACANSMMPQLPPAPPMPSPTKSPYSLNSFNSSTEHPTPNTPSAPPPCSPTATPPPTTNTTTIASVTVGGTTNATIDVAANAVASGVTHAANHVIQPTLAHIAKSLRDASRTPKRQKTAASGTSDTRGTAESGSVTRWRWCMFPGKNLQPTWAGIPARVMVNEGVGRQPTGVLRQTGGRRRKDSLKILILFLTTNLLSTHPFQITIVLFRSMLQTHPALPANHSSLSRRHNLHQYPSPAPSNTRLNEKP